MLAIKFRCIFCREESCGGRSEEHVVPEGIWPSKTALVYPPGTVVCDRCNNRLSPLDQALQNALAVNKVIVGQPTKKGKSPNVRFRNAYLEPGKIAVNCGSRSIEGPHGIMLKPPKAQGKDLEFFETGRDGETVHLSFRVQLNLNQRAIRGLHKIALEWALFTFGLPTILEDRFDPIRGYVLEGISHRRVAIGKPSAIVPLDKWNHRLDNIYLGPSGAPIVPIELYGIYFVVSLGAGDTDLLVLPQMFPERFFIVGIEGKVEAL